MFDAKRMFGNLKLCTYDCLSKVYQYYRTYLHTKLYDIVRKLNYLDQIKHYINIYVQILNMIIGIKLFVKICR